eukprot:CAMPEP_0202444360 /NCGR_PEP_ID=MMETSP1360-20130828/3470_1 /ASSEMBLY_ACC=CAM_ASM_000848 /TAXON_ID=515479 /ORGANISM="Licmophora paradoxa, Strain CCMP2313" /LENGTH=103 /DNA_ID=CAMNT_0049060341 /DNA_START=162 /DNA_END=473 /DNA_ORIENTATION=-
MVLGLEELKQDWNGVFLHILRFLGLPKWIPEEIPVVRSSNVNSNVNGNGNEKTIIVIEEEEAEQILRDQLNEFYEPYNARLKVRLGKDFQLTQNDAASLLQEE